MAKLSRNQRHKARQRRTLSLLKREFRKLYQQHHNAMFALVSLLYQADKDGGTATLTEETLKAVLAKLPNFSWKSERQENGDVKLTLVDTTPAAEEQPTANSVSVRYVDDETVDPPQDDLTPAEVDEIVAGGVDTVVDDGA